MLFIGLAIFMALTLFAIAKQMGSNGSKKSAFSFPKLDEQEYQLDLPVLTYHYIREVANPEQDKLGFSLSVTPADFREQMRYLVEHNYRTVTPLEVLAALRNKEPLPSKSVLLTFDDGYQNFYTAAFPVLKEYHLSATAFVVSGFVGRQPTRYLSWSEVRELDASGLVTIASHTIGHVNLVKSTDAFRQLTQSKKTLERELQHPVTVFSYPFGTFDDRVAGLVEQAGYEITFTTKIGTVMRYSNRFILPRVRVSGGLQLSQFPGKLAPLPEKNSTGHTGESFVEPHPNAVK
ncbi:MAG: polysaccharide deacetylase family protein [Patescibacteria group bacterium]